ncbi:YkuS family protein [Tepidibacillus infernus]|uniref:YkuS family protein n=1 Tax=Tepidibacillus infernus TaxID=1806172 RepID=UPI003A218F83
MPRVAMEQSLNYLKDYLTSQGVEVTDLNQQTGQVDAVIISGQDKDVMGMEDITSKVPVINARGLTPEEVYQAINRQ